MQMVETAETSLRSEFGASPAASEAYRDGIPTFWAHREQVHSILAFLKERAPGPYKMLYDLTAIDERTRTHRGSEPTGDFTVVYHLFSFERNEYIRLKTALDQDALSVDTITDLWPAANWYEREVWDMFGITFSGHPHLTRILMPATWEGHPLRKDHPARATEMGEFRLPDAKAGCRTGGTSIPPRGMGHGAYSWRQRHYLPEYWPAASWHARRPARRSSTRR
jgi:NADH-quinone oxidoreductase subunit C/D